MSRSVPSQVSLTPARHSGGLRTNQRPRQGKRTQSICLREFTARRSNFVLAFFVCHTFGIGGVEGSVSPRKLLLGCPSVLDCISVIIIIVVVVGAITISNINVASPSFSSSTYSPSHRRGRCRHRLSCRCRSRHCPFSCCWKRIGGKKSHSCTRIGARAGERASK